MSEQLFSNIEPLDNTEVSGVANENELVDSSNNSHPKEIKSNKYTDIKLLVESRYGKSRVFKAKSSSGTVIVKALKKKYADDPKSNSLLRNEYEITASLDNRYIRKALAYEKIEGLGNCIVFEYIPGKTLWEHVRLGTIDERQVKNILFEICDALSYMHKNGVVHCDLRPDNIIITEDYHVKIIDIGMPETEYEANKEILVKELEFIAPELIKGEEGDARSDIYSVGKIMEYMYSRNMMKQFIEAATPCTQYSKEQRYENISELKSAMSTSTSSSKVVIIVISVVVLALIVFGISRIISSRKDNESHQLEEAKFASALTEIENNIPMLRDKYAIKDMMEPLRPDWTEDSMRLAQKFNDLELTSEMKEKEAEALQKVSDAIYQSRKTNFERILVAEYDKAQDGVALKLKNALPNPTAEQTSQNAAVWFEKYVKVTKAGK